jgi:hypothetical protein
MPDIQNNFVQSKMNQDLDDRLIPQGEYRSAQNVAISRSQGEDVGALENIEGNNIITNSSLSSYENLDVIGYYVDPSENNVYYFLTDYVDSSNNGIDNFAPSSANCFIYRFNNTGNGTFTKLVEGYFLNFSKNSPIYGVSIIENLLFFTDYRNQPRKINVNKAANDISYYQTEDQISVAKYAPYEPIKFVDLAYNNTLKSTFSNPSEEYLPVNISSDVTTSSGTAVTTVDFTQVAANYIPQVGSKIISNSNANLNGKIVEASPVPTSTQVSFTGGVIVTVGDDISFAQPNPDYDADFGGDPEYLSTRFVRFSYRFVFDDGEYSLIAPFSQICYIPKQDGYFIKEDSEQAYRSTIIKFMENNVAQAILNIIMPCEWISSTNNPETKFHINKVEILYKESDQVSIKLVETIPIDTVLSNMEKNANKSVYTYKYISTKPYRTLPSDQLTRVYDKVPVRAFSQEAVSNRIIYGNFIDKHSSPSSLNYGIGQADKNSYVSSSTEIYSQIEYPSSTLKQNRNYQIGIVLSDRYGRSSTTILSSRDKKQTENSVGYIGSTIYVPYELPASILDFPGLALKILFDTASGSSSVIPESITGLEGYPGVYVPIGAVDTFDALSFPLGTGYPAGVTDQETTTTGGSGTGLTVNITTNSSGNITNVIVNKPGEGYTEDDTITISGGSGGTATIQFLKQPNILGWYSYKLVVRQTEQDYYNVYVPGILNGYPDPASGTTPFPTNEDGSTSHVVLLNDNINKVPRDLSEVGPEQRQFRSSVELFGRVVNTQPSSSVATFSNQYEPEILPDTVSTIADTDDLDFTDTTLSSEGQANFYQFNTKPLIGRISTSKALGAVSDTGTPANNMIPQLAVLETEAVESSLDIYYETSTTGLVEELNRLSASSSDNPVAFSFISSGTYSQNENQPIGINVIGQAGSPVLCVNSNNTVVTGRTFSISSVTNTAGTVIRNDGSGNAINPPFTITNNGNGFFISTSAFFPFSSIASENTFEFSIECLDNASGNSVNLPLIGTLNNTVPAFGTTPTTLTASSSGNISGGIYNNGATNGVEAGAIASDKIQGLTYSIQPGGVTLPAGATDSNNFGFNITADGSQLSLSSLPADGVYTVVVTLTDGGGLTATTSTNVTVFSSITVPFRFWFDYLATASSTAVKLQGSFWFSNATPLTTLIGGSGGVTPTGGNGSNQGEYRYLVFGGTMSSYPPTDVLSITSANAGSGYSPTNQQLNNLSTTYNAPSQPQNGSGLKVNAFSLSGQLKPSTIQIIQGGNGQYQTGDQLNVEGTTGVKAIIALDKGSKIEARINGQSTATTIPAGTKLEIQLYKGTPGQPGAVAIGSLTTLNGTIYQSGFWTQIIDGTNLNNGDTDGYTVYMQLKNN